MYDIHYPETAAKLNHAVYMDKSDSIAVVFIDNPPVNAGSTVVRQGLLAAVLEAGADSAIEGIVLVGAGKTFIAGSDIKEFGKALLPPELPDVLAAIEACPKPIIAAIHGSALGGGYELALACDWRIAAPGAEVGLPEVGLGMIPGAGGTQRLPRLVGLPRGIELISLSRRVPAAKAIELGMVDALAGADLIADAKAFLVGRGKRLTSMLTPPPASEEAIDAAVTAALAKGQGLESVCEAIAMIRLIQTTPVAEALALERATFQRLRIGEEARALRYNFFGERAAAKLNVAVTPRQVLSAGVVGAGTMGAGIATILLASGLPVTLVDSNQQALDHAASTIHSNLAALEKLGRLGGMSTADSQACLVRTDRLDALAAADLVIEAVFEDLEAKTSVLSELGSLLKPGAIIATNTSYLDIEQLAGASKRTPDFVGLHFFAPVTQMRLLEVVQCSGTTPEVVAAAFTLARTVGKLPILARPSEGFIGNRIYARYRAQCEYGLEEGSLPQQIDAVTTDLGFAMGLFAVSDISGLDIAWRLRQNKAAGRDPRERYVRLPDIICELGRLGRKTKAGWYDYDSDGKPNPSPEVTDLVLKAAATAGRTPPVASLLTDRIMGAIVNEAALIVSEGIARSASDIDVVLVNGYGFSRRKGGPLFQAASLSSERVDAMVAAAESAAGWGFRRGDVEALLEPLRNN